jgi:UDP:flavonoid glycosyltransferase YjiC (YdhE family)
MAEILFVTWDGGGNVPPALGIARELQRRGHTVRFVGHGSQTERFAGTGLPFEPFPGARRFSSTTPSSTATLLGVFGDRAMGRDVVSGLARHPADVVVVDCLLFGVMDELRRAGRPYVVLEHSFDGYFRRAAKGPLGLVLRMRGFRALDLVDAGRPVLATTLAELDTGHGPVTHTGPVLDVSGPARSARPAEPTVLASLSTFAFRSLVPTWQRVLDAVEGLPVRVIATTGPAVDPGALRVPANVELHRWLPHETVLPSVSVVVGHGGHATTMIALAHDVPVLILPLDAKSDQPFVGRTVERAGAGRTLSRRSSPRRIRAAIEELLADGPHLAAAARLGEQVRSSPGAANAADRIEAVTDGAAEPGRPAARP